MALLGLSLSFVDANLFLTSSNKVRASEMACEGLAISSSWNRDRRAEHKFCQRIRLQGLEEDLQFHHLIHSPTQAVTLPNA